MSIKGIRLTDTNVFISCPSTLKIKGSCYSAPETTESNLIVPIKGTSLKIQKDDRQPWWDSTCFYIPINSARRAYALQSSTINNHSMSQRDIRLVNRINLDYTVGVTVFLKLGFCPLCDKHYTTIIQRATRHVNLTIFPAIVKAPRVGIFYCVNSQLPMEG